jgi:hypothetical protein
MIVIDKTIVSDDVLEKEFVCKLTACKGACCVIGESGAPLEKDETKKLEEIFPIVKEYMNEKGIHEIEKQGKWMIDKDGDYVTPLINGDEECAYVFFDENKIAKCAIEKAFYEGKIDFKKPISCHLYPVRITKHKKYDAVNYEYWKGCAPACVNGKELGVPVYKFLKDALIRKFGEKWYEQLSLAAETFYREKK